jgi:hypothetical protein
VVLLQGNKPKAAEAPAPRSSRRVVAIGSIPFVLSSLKHPTTLGMCRRVNFSSLNHYQVPHLYAEPDIPNFAHASISNSHRQPAASLELNRLCIVRLS